jgi:hypothetical protein
MKSIKFISNISISIPSDQEVSKIILHDKINQPFASRETKAIVSFICP